jgi:pimeloyl-ACP methyl ester carboxylesterase
MKGQTLTLTPDVQLNDLEANLDFSIDALRDQIDTASNFLAETTWDDERFNDANVRLGMWQPYHFQQTIGYGLYTLEPFDPQRKTVLLVHGINDSPRVFREIVEKLLGDYQILLYHYPSGEPLQHTAYLASVAVGELIRRGGLEELNVIAHSMGGLVTAGLLFQLDAEQKQSIRTYVTISTPFAGHAGAALGVKWARTVAPVWWAMAPGSQYLNKLSELDLSAGPDHHLLFSYARERGGESHGDDGVVSVKSQLAPPMQRQTRGVYGIDDTHVGIMSNPCTLSILAAILQDGRQRVAYPLCTQSAN